MINKKLSPWWLSWIILSTIPITLGLTHISNEFNIGFLPHMGILIQFIFIISCFLNKTKGGNNNE